MHRRILAALFLSLATLPVTVARQDQMLASQERAVTDERHLSRADDAQQSKSDIRQRGGPPKRHERLLSRNPKEIIPDICVGC